MAHRHLRHLGRHPAGRIPPPLLRERHPVRSARLDLTIAAGNSAAWTLIESILAGSEAIVALGITLEDMGENRIVLKMPKRPSLMLDGTIYHGGPVASLIDVAGDMVVAVRAGGGVPTISLRVDYLRPCTGPWLLATARLRRGGRTISVSDVDVHDDQGRLCAVGRGTYSSRVG